MIEEDEDISITATAVQNLSVSQGTDDKSTESTASSPIPQTDLLSSWVNDFRAKRTDVRIALSILQVRGSLFLHLNIYLCSGKREVKFRRQRQKWD